MSIPVSVSEKAGWLEQHLVAHFYSADKPQISEVVIEMLPNLSSVGVERIYEILTDYADENVNYGGTK